MTPLNRDRGRHVDGPDGVGVVSLTGEYDINSATPLRDALAGAITAGRDVVVDLSRVTYMDASIVRVLVSGRDAALEQSRDLRVRAPSPIAHRVLAICGLLELIEAEPPELRVGPGGDEARPSTPDSPMMIPSATPATAVAS